MAIDDQIKNEKLQYDINREAAKISASSSGKIDKYEYLTGKEILPCNQKQIIEQAKFTYSPLGKSFEKQTKTTEDQGKKQVEAIKEHGKQLVKSNKDVGKKNRLHKKQEDEICDELSYERIDEIKDLSGQMDFNNLSYYFKSKDSSPIN